MNIVSKRQTLHLTRHKYYEVIKFDGHRYTIINDCGEVCTSSDKNFYNLQEIREFKLKKLNIV
jgi:hypothetical protein